MSSRLFVALVLASACTPSLESDLRQAGHFAELQAFDAGGQGYAAALRDPVGGVGDLTLVRLGDGSACTAGRADAFFPRRGPGDAPVLVAWEPDAGLAFYDGACQPLLGPIPSAAPRAVQEAIFGGAYRHHLVITTEDDRLLLVEPFTRDVIDLSAEEPVYDYRWEGVDHAWLHRGRSLVLTDLDGSVVRALGEDVTEVVWTASGAAAYVDGGDLWLVEGPEAAPKALAEDVCELRPRPASETLLYLAPCASRTLVLHHLAAAPVALVDDVGAFRHDTSPIFYIPGDPGAEVGQIWALVGHTPVLVADRAYLTSLRRISGGSHLFLAGERENGDLLAFDGSTRLLRSDVSRFDARHGRLAVLTDRWGQGGTLWLGESAATLEPIAAGVPLRGFDYATQLQAFGFIADSQAGAGRLEVIILPTDDRVTVAEGVSELAELRSDTTPGLAYIIATGENAGIWFATPE